VASPAAGRVIPVAPVNPAPELGTPDGVVNDINPELQVKAAQRLSETDGQRTEGESGAAQGTDWTERFKAGKPEEPPKEPLSKMLMEHIQTLWSASARAVELWVMQNQPQSQDPNRIQQLAEHRKQDPSAIPGVLAHEVLTYSPSKIRKPEKLD